MIAATHGPDVGKFTTKQFQFGGFTLDQSRYRLQRGDRLLRLEKIPMELLILLVSRRGDLVSREEIEEHLWGKDVFVDVDHSINVAIRKVRVVLGDDPEKPRFVETVVGKGYRFGAPVVCGDGVLSSEALPATSPAEAAAVPELFSKASGPNVSPRKSRFVSSHTKILFAGAVILVLAMLSYVLYRGGNARIARQPAIKSLAVLPLKNLSGDPSQEYLAEGLTEAVISRLSGIHDLRVISRTSAMHFKDSQLTVPEIAEILHVDAIVEGSMIRDGNRIRVHAQLIRADDEHFWSETYDRQLTDVLALESEVAQSIAGKVGVTASSNSTKPEKRISPEAHDAYLMGRYYWFSDDHERSRQYFQKAIDLQPDYAAAWSGLADSYGLKAVNGDARPDDVMPQWDDAARKAVALDDSLPEAHNTMAAFYLVYRWDLQQAERESARTLELNPNFAEGHHLRGYVLQALNRTDEAIQEQRKAIELDPFARPWELAYALMRARQFDAALNEARLRGQAQPDNAAIHEALGAAYWLKGMEKEAAQEWEMFHQLAGDTKGARSIHQAFQRGGAKGVFELQLADNLRRKAAGKYVSPLELASIYASLKQKEETLHYLEQSYQERAPWLVRIQSDPYFDFLHSDPRYQAIVKKMGLPPAS